MRLDSGLWNSRQQAAWSCRQDDLQSGDQLPHQTIPPTSPFGVRRLVAAFPLPMLW
jgi:hypothetical protein